MPVIPITVFLSLGLVFIFVALFWREQRRNRFASPERDSLLPLAEETPRPAAPDGPGQPDLRTHSASEHPTKDCGCERGERPPCAGCLRHAAPAVTPAL
jgi:hypothetical protein